MSWTKEEGEAVNKFIRGFGIVKEAYEIVQDMSEESKEKVMDYALLFQRTAFNIDFKEPPRGMII